jgi:hypothetical protein
MAARDQRTALPEVTRPGAPAEPPPFTVQQVQEYTTDSATGIRRLLRERNYVRLRETPDAPPMFLQSGKLWMESGERVEPVPEWVAVRLAQMPVAVREAVGWRD